MADKHSSGIFPIYLKPEVQGLRSGYAPDLATALSDVLAPSAWDGVPSREAIAIALERVCEVMGNPKVGEELWESAGLLRSLANTLRDQDQSGWRIDLKGKPGPKPTRKDRAERSRRLVSIGLFYRERCNQLGPGSSRAAEIDTAKAFGCSIGDVSEGVKEVRKAERLYEEVQRQIDALRLDTALQAALSKLSPTDRS